MASRVGRGSKPAVRLKVGVSSADIGERTAVKQPS